jgi:hypothetical protein
MAGQRARRLSIFAKRFARSPARSPSQRAQTTRLRSFGRVAASGCRIMAGEPAARLARRIAGRRPAQDRAVDRTTRRRDRRLAGHSSRSILQRQHAGRCALRGGNCGAISASVIGAAFALRYWRRAVGSQGWADRHAASKPSILSRYSSVTSISSIPCSSLSLRNGLISNEWAVPSGVIRD